MNPILEKIRKASKRMQRTRCQILQPREYCFTVLEVREERDEKRQYDYLHVRLDCEGQLTSDRFPFVDNMLWKLNDFLAAVDLDADFWTETMQLVGRSGKLEAEAQTDGKTFYRYLPAEAEALS